MYLVKHCDHYDYVGIIIMNVVAILERLLSIQGQQQHSLQPLQKINIRIVPNKQCNLELADL